MRDPNRIRSMLNKLEAMWSQHPDLRFFQLIAILMPKKLQVHLTDKEEGLIMGYRTPFYIEDDEAEELIDKMLEKYGKP